MVEWKKLGEVTNIVRGNRVTKSDLIENGKYPVISGGFSPLGYIDNYNRDKNTITIAQYGSAGYVDWQKDKFWANDVCYSVYPLASLNNRFLYYVLIDRQYDIYSLRTNAVPAHLPLKSLQEINIPIPSLSEQQRIVDQLDTFTSSIENLKEQIDLRRKQYEYYRDQLLDLEGKEGVEMKTLPEISKNCDRERKPITSSKRVSGKFPYYGASGIVDYIEGYIFDGDYLLISEDGANLLARTTPIAFSIKGKNWVNNHAHVLQFKEMVTQKFVEIYLNMICLEPWINGAAQPKLNQDNLNRIELPIPSLSEQSRIVSILDTFEASIQNLEAQLSQREKQYEYYRNKLLTFE